MFADDDSDDEGNGNSALNVGVKLTPAQAKRELDELDEFKALGLLSAKECVFIVILFIILI